jgi:hypothetical protein
VWQQIADDLIRDGAVFSIGGGDTVYLPGHWHATFYRLLDPDSVSDLMHSAGDVGAAGTGDYRLGGYTELVDLSDWAQGAPDGYRISPAVVSDPYRVALHDPETGRAVIFPDISLAAFCFAFIHERQHALQHDPGPVRRKSPERRWVDQQVTRARSRGEYHELDGRARREAVCLRSEQV